MKFDGGKKMKNNQRGFTLLEVLFSLVILSVGLLGYAALQMQSTKRSGDAFNKVWAQYHMKQVADVMAAMPLAMEWNVFQTNDFVGYTADRTGYSSGDIGDMYSKRGCFSQKTGGNPFLDGGSAAVDANIIGFSANPTMECDDKTFASEYLYKMVAYNMERELPNARISIQCEDIDPNDGSNLGCSRKGSKVTMTMVWSYDQNRQGVPASNRGCNAGRSTENVTQSAAVGAEASLSQSGDECVTFSYFY